MSYKFRTQSTRGFTLIELLVAISIIVLITAIAAVNYVPANRNARDARRQSDLEQVRAALETYRFDQDEYPQVANYGALIPELQTGTANNYLRNAPNDPRPNQWVYFYQSTTTTSYELCARLETTGAINTPCAVPGGTDCDAAAAVACNYCTCNP